MKKPDIYYIVGCVILALVGFGTLLFLMFNSKCKPKCDGINCADGCGGTCCYTEMNNTTKPETAESESARLSSCYISNEQSVKDLCDNIDECKGYYVSNTTNLFLTTDKNPLDCTPDSPSSTWDNSNFNTFKTKGPNKDYLSSKNTSTSSTVCHKRFYAQKGPDATKKLCDKLPGCKGYYKGYYNKDFDKSVYIVSDKDPGGVEDDACASDDDDLDYNGYYTFPSFYKKPTTKNI